MQMDKMIQLRAKDKKSVFTKYSHMLFYETFLKQLFRKVRGKTGIKNTYWANSRQKKGTISDMNIRINRF